MANGNGFNGNGGPILGWANTIVKLGANGVLCVLVLWGAQMLASEMRDARITYRDELRLLREQMTFDRETIQKEMKADREAIQRAVTSFEEAAMAVTKALNGRKGL